MKKVICCLLVVLQVVFLFQAGGIPSVYAIIPGEDAMTAEEKIYADATLEDDFTPDRVLLVLTNAASTSLKSYTASDFPEIDCMAVNNLTSVATDIVNAEITGTDISAKYSVASDTITFHDFHNVDIGTFHQVLSLGLENPGKEKVLNAIAKLEQRDDVLYAGPNYVVSLCATEPNDTFRLYQWAISKINLPEVWDLETGELSVEVGVLDTGIDGDHPDLTNRVSVSRSRDYSYGGSSTLTEVIDPHGHGTHVAGIIGAQGNNSIGVTGVGWYTRLVSLRVFNAAGTGTLEYVVSAINYATDYGIPILNYSGGAYSEYVPLYAAIESYPGLFVCSAGNENYDIDQTRYYPGSYNLDNLITVGSSNRDDLKSDTSNYGKTTVDLFAPGEAIVSCYPVDKCLDGTHDTDDSIHIGDGYHYLSGTSMAAPYVTGVAALILSMHPSCTPETIKEWIMDGVDVVTDSDGNSVFGDYCISGGRLNAYAAVNRHLNDTYTSVSFSQHRHTCECGLNLLESHTWKTETITGAGGTVIKMRKCTRCGYTKTLT